MQILAMKKFEDKLNALGPSYKDNVIKFFSSVKKMSEDDLSRNFLGFNKLNKIFVYKIGALRLFYNFIKNNGKLILIFLDLTFDIAPLNQSRNPNYNSLINPNYNSQINPNYNSLINPNYNSQINPNYNSLINPNYNSQINPRYNSLFSGYYFYDLEINALEFTIPANGDVLLFFNFSGEFKRYGIKHSQDGYVIFDISNRWAGHLESDGGNGFNYFDINNRWTGFLK